MIFHALTLIPLCTAVCGDTGSVIGVLYEGCPSSAVEITTGAFASIANCVFQECATTEDGGGIYIEVTDFSAEIESCDFIRCASTRQGLPGGGGGLYFNGAILELRMCTFSACEARNTNAGAMFVRRDGVPSDGWNLTDTVVALSYSQQNTVCFNRMSSVTFSLRQSNITNNHADLFGSAIYLSELASSFVFQFCQAVSNTIANCVMFESPQGVGSLRCLSIRDNECSSSDENWGGLFYLGVRVWPIYDSIIAGNEWDIYCGSGEFVYENCINQEDGPTPAPGQVYQPACLSRTPAKTAIPPHTPTASFSQPPPSASLARFTIYRVLASLFVYAGR
jgi:hypothetical protein